MRLGTGSGVNAMGVLQAKVLRYASKVFL